VKRAGEFREFKAQGEAGGSTVVRKHIHPKRLLRPSNATVRFETAPGEQLQHGWASSGR
jgi:transposase